MPAWRLLYRIPWLALHLAIGLPAALLSFLPPFTVLRIGDRTINDRMQCWWAGTVCRIFGLRVRATGAFAPGPQLIVANHISWLDIQVLHSLSTMGFVAKAEIERWPLAGWLARVGDTVFHDRGSHDSARGVVGTMTDRLRAGRKVAVFAEGGILPGAGIKRFHARLFSAAQESGAPVQPVMIRYLRHGARDDDMTFRPDERFMANLLRLLSRPPCIAEVWILAPFLPDDLPRRALAERAQATVEGAYFEEPLW